MSVNSEQGRKNNGNVDSVSTTKPDSCDIQDNSQEDDPENSDDNQPAQIPYRRDRTPSIIVQSLGLQDGKSTYLTESIELTGEEEDTSQNSTNSSDANSDRKSNASGWDESSQANQAACDGSGGSTKGSLSSIPSSASTGQVSQQTPISAPRPRSPKTTPGTNRRLSLTITSTAPRRLSLTVEGMTGSLLNQQQGLNEGASQYPSGNATGSLRNKVALKPGHSLMGWTKLASTAKDLSGTGGKTIEVTPEELAKHDSESDCWVALNGNVYNVTTYLHYHPGGIEELMRGAGRDATDLFNEVHRWVNYETILAKCLVGPYKLESPT